MTSNIVALTNQPATMSSVEIAELTGKNHFHVLRDLKELEKQGVIALSNFGERETYGKGNERTVYKLPKRETLILTSGYSAVQRAAIIDRWLALEEVAAPKLQMQKPRDILEDWLGAAALLGVPAHIGQQEAVKAAREATGVDYTRLLQVSPAQDNIPQSEVMLEPTELAKHFGFKSAQAMNRELADHGLQAKVNGRWIPTRRGTEYCATHAWSKDNKTGYNLKWNVEKLQGLIG